MERQSLAVFAGTLGLFLLVLFFVVPVTNSVPVGVGILSNTTSSLPDVLTNRTDDGGTITTLYLDVQQQNDLWKGYVGNVTGKLTLDDADGYSIYDWTFNITVGEVYIARATSVNWSGAQCAPITTIEAEETYFGMINQTDYDEISDTFNETIHANFRVGTVNITNSTCPSTFTFVNDSQYPTINETTPFQEVLLQMNGTTDELVYTALLVTDTMGFHENYTYDFQAIVPDNETYGGLTTYYFWAELGY